MADSTTEICTENITKQSSTQRENTTETSKIMNNIQITHTGELPSCSSPTEMEIPMSPLQRSLTEAQFEAAGSLNNSFNAGEGCSGTGSTSQSRDRKECVRNKRRVDDKKPLLDEMPSCSFDLESTDITDDLAANDNFDVNHDMLNSSHASCQFNNRLNSSHGSGQFNDRLNSSHTSCQLNDRLNSSHTSCQLNDRLNSSHTSCQPNDRLNSSHNSWTMPGQPSDPQPTETAVEPNPKATNPRPEPVQLDSLTPRDPEVCKGDVSGSTTPRRSARSPRFSFKHGRLYGYGEPIMPGYTASSNTSGLVIKRTLEVQQEIRDEETNLRDAIPIMPKPVAYCCFFFNLIIPGLGTLVSGFTVLCCSRPQKKEHTRFSTVWTNAVVALFQLLTVIVFLLGWVWSILWGTSFIQYSQEYNKIKHEENTEESSRRPSVVTPIHSSRSNNRVTTRTTMTTSIELPGTSSDSNQDPQHPIIVLQEAPVVVQSEEQEDISDLMRPSRTLNPYNPRHQRIMRRQWSEDDLGPMLLDPQAIENMVLNNVPVPHHLVGGAPNIKQ